MPASRQVLVEHSQDVGRLGEADWPSLQLLVLLQVVQKSLKTTQECVQRFHTCTWLACPHFHQVRVAWFCTMGIGIGSASFSKAFHSPKLELSVGLGSRCFFLFLPRLSFMHDLGCQHMIGCIANNLTISKDDIAFGILRNGEIVGH